MEDIQAILKEARELENTDEYERAVALFGKALEHYGKNSDFENSVYCLTKSMRILKKESEFYRVGTLQVKTAQLYIKKADNLNAARWFSRAGSSFKAVSAFSESARAYEESGDMFLALKGEFFLEAAKHYKLAAIYFIDQEQSQFVEYLRLYGKTLDAYSRAEKERQITYKNYVLYVTNFYSEIQEALNRNGFYREEKEVYIKKMDYIRLGHKLRKGGFGKYAGLSIWKYTCLYGESAFLWLGWICGHILTFSCIFYYLKLVTLPDGAFLSFKESVFFAVDIFATLGFGSYELVSDLARFMVGLDVMSGYFMMALLITIFARRLTR